MFELLGFDIVATSYIRVDWFYTNSMCRKKDIIQQFESFLRFFLNMIESRKDNETEDECGVLIFLLFSFLRYIIIEKKHGRRNGRWKKSLG